MEEPLINELLLVGATLGSTEVVQGEDGSFVERFIRGEDCVEWLSDLQRVLRRDDDLTREVAVKLGTWKIVDTKLLPLLFEARDDLELVVTTFKILVMLTMPVNPKVKHWARLEVKAKENDGEDRAETLRKRRAAQAQITNLLAMKRAMVNEDLVAVMVAIMEEPLSRAQSRKDNDTLVIDLVLTLLRNLLAIDNPGAEGSGDALQHELLVLLEKEYVTDVLIFLCQNVQQKEIAPWNLLLLEILFHMTRGQEPSEVACVNAESGAGRAAARQQTLQRLQHQEQLARSGMSDRAGGSRHSRFGTTLRLVGMNGVSGRLITNPFKDPVAVQPQLKRKRARGRQKARVTGMESELRGGLDRSPVTQAAHRVLYRVTREILEAAAYEPFIKSIKDELRRDSARLDEAHRVLYFRLTSFFFAFARLARRPASEGPAELAGSLVHSMDLLSFNLLLKNMESMIDQTSFGALVHAVALYKEMLLLVELCANDAEAAHRTVAIGLQHRLFYANEPLDRVLKLISCWKPGLFPLRYMCDVLDICQTQLRLHERNTSLLEQPPADSADNKRLRELLDNTGKFDFNRFFAQLCSNQMVRMLTTLLESYATNSAATNSQVVSFLERLRTFDLERRWALKRGGKAADEDQVRQLLCARCRMCRRRGCGVQIGSEAAKPTLEPVLFSLPMLITLGRIISDRHVTQTSDNCDLWRFSRAVVRGFGTLVEKNPLLVVEAMFPHPFPFVYCENVQRTYCAGGTLETLTQTRVRGTDHKGDHDSSDDEEQEEEEAQQRARTRAPDPQADAGDSEDEWDGAAPLASTRNDREPDKPPKPKPRRRRAPKWDPEEDAALQKHAASYSGSKSMADVLARLPELVKRGRTADQVLRRLRFLESLAKTGGRGQGTQDQDQLDDDVSGDGEEEESTARHDSEKEDEAADRDPRAAAGHEVTEHAAPPNKRRRLKKSQVTASSSSDSELDILP